MGFGLGKKFGNILGKALTVFGTVLAMNPATSWLGWGMIIAGGALSALTADAFEKKPQSPAMSAHRLNVRSSRSPLPLVYGEVEIGCNKTYYHNVNPYLHIICELGEGPMYGIRRQGGTYFTDTATELPSDDPPLVYFDNELWTTYGTSNVYMEWFDGSATQTICTTLNTASSGNWDQLLRHTSYLYVRLKFDQDKFKKEPDITVVMKGLEVTDPIAATTDWSANPALIAYDLITRSSQRGGLGVAAAKLDTTSLETARDYCTAKGWTCNLPITDQRAVADNLEQILACYRGVIIYSEGKFKFRFADLNYETVSMDFTEADTINGSLSIGMPNTSERYNALRITYLDKDKNYKSNDFTFSSESAVAEDGDYREFAIALYGLTDIDYVQKMANYLLERNRLQKNVSFVVGERGKALEPYDLITLTHSMPGWSSHTLRVLSATILPDYTVALNCIDEAETLYDDTYDLVARDYHSTILVDPNSTPDVTNISATEETYVFRLRTQSRLNVTFTAPENFPFFDFVQVWISTDAATWKHQFNARDDFSIDPVEEDQTYYVKLVTVNTFGTEADFASSPTASVFINGKVSTAPTSLTSLQAVYTGTTLNVFADKVNDSDVELYEFRLGASWTGAIFLSALRSPNLSLGGVRPGNHTIWCNTLGTNGVYGDTPRSVTVSIPDPLIGWAVVSTLGPSSYIITNGDMELDANWADSGTPSTNVQITVAAYEGNYSRKFLVEESSIVGGIVQTGLSLVSGQKYSWSLWLYPSTANAARVTIRDGTAVGYTTFAYSTLTPGQWNFLNGTYTEPAGGADGAFYIRNDASTGNFYVDNVVMLRGPSTQCGGYLYNSSVYIRNTHPDSTAGYSTDLLNGQWKSQIYDASTSRQVLAYILTDYTVLGGGGNWEDRLTRSTMTWTQSGMTTVTRWSDYFAPSEAPSVSININYGDTTALGSVMERAEILSGVITGRYFQSEINISDPQQSIYALVNAPTIKLAT